MGKEKNSEKHNKMGEGKFAAQQEKENSRLN